MKSHQNHHVSHPLPVFTWSFCPLGWQRTEPALQRSPTSAGWPTRYTCWQTYKIIYLFSTYWQTHYSINVYNPTKLCNTSQTDRPLIHVDKPTSWQYSSIQRRLTDLLYMFKNLHNYLLIQRRLTDQLYMMTTLNNLFIHQSLTNIWWILTTILWNTKKHSYI